MFPSNIKNWLAYKDKQDNISNILRRSPTDCIKIAKRRVLHIYQDH